MMRKMFWILLLGNAVLFAGMQRGWLGWGEHNPQAQPALHGEMIRLLDAVHQAPADVLATPGHSSKLAPIHPEKPASEPGKDKVYSPSPSKLQLALSMSSQQEVAPAIPLVCLEWGDFSGPDLARAEAELYAMQFGNKLSQHQVERDIGYWVYMAPLKNKAAVNRKVGELKELGINEYFVIQNPGRWKNAISLGVFKTQESAQNYLNFLHTKGVRTARVGERASKLKATIFRFNRTDPATVAKLTAMQKEFAGSELKNVPCTLTR